MIKMHFYHLASVSVFITRGFEAAPALPTPVIPGPFPNALAPGASHPARLSERSGGKWDGVLLSFLFFSNKFLTSTEKNCKAWKSKFHNLEC